MDGRVGVGSLISISYCPSWDGMIYFDDFLSILLNLRYLPVFFSRFIPGHAHALLAICDKNDHSVGPVPISFSSFHIAGIDIFRKQVCWVVERLCCWLWLGCLCTHERMDSLVAHGNRQKLLCSDRPSHDFSAERAVFLSSMNYFQISAAQDTLLFLEKLARWLWHWLTE